MARAANRWWRMRRQVLLVGLALAAVVGIAVAPHVGGGASHGLARAATVAHQDLHQAVAHLPTAERRIAAGTARGLVPASVLAVLLFLAAGASRRRPARLLVVEPGHPQRSSHGHSARRRGPPAPSHQ